MDDGSMRDVIVTAVESFPAMSPTATKVLTLLSNPRSNASDVQEIVRYDPGLTGNILKLANSAFFGAPGTIGSVGQAVTRLGWKRTYQLTMAATVNGMLAGPLVGYDLPAGELWRHAVAVSVAAEVLAKEHGLVAVDDTFTAALLHDVGKMVMGPFVEPYFDLIEVAASRGISFELAEHEVLGTDHAEVGAMILENWSLPAPLVEAVRWHHNPDAAQPPMQMPDIVHMADLLVMVLGIGVGRDGIQYNSSLGATTRTGLQADRLRAAATQTLEGFEELSRALATEPAAV